MDATVVDKQAVIDTVAAVRSLCARLDPVLIPLHEVPEVYDELVSLRKLADGALLRMTGRYEESAAWKRNGAKSAEDDIAAKTGSTTGAARRRLSTSKRLPTQSKTEDAVKQGELSEEQAAEVSSGAHASPGDEDELLDAARKRPLRELKKKSAGSRARAEDSEARARRLFKARCMRRFQDHEGMENLLLKLPPERMAEIDAFLNRFIDREYADARDRGLLEDYENYAADVVYRLLTGRHPNRSAAGRRPASTTEPTEAGGPTDADTGAGAGANDTDHPEPADSPAADQPAQARNANAVRPDRKVLAIIDVRALNRGRVEGEEMCEIAGVGPVSVAAVRSMLSDAFLALVFKDGVDVLNVTHLGRQVTAQQLTALEARGWWCERCGSTYRVQIDHDTGWTLTHDTCLEDLRLACEHCHDLKTRHGLRWSGPFGEGILVDTDGRPWKVPPRARATGPPGAVAPDGSNPPAGDGADPDDPKLFTLAD